MILSFTGCGHLGALFYEYKVACMCFIALNGSGPAYLSELLHVCTPSRTLRSSSDTRMLKIQQYKRKIHGFRTFSCFGPHIWNLLPQDLRHCSTLSSFKAKLKTTSSHSISTPANINTQFLLQSVCVCVCVCVRACVRACVCVCVCWDGKQKTKTLQSKSKRNKYRRKEKRKKERKQKRKKGRRRRRKKKEKEIGLLNNSNS